MNRNKWPGMIVALTLTLVMASFALAPPFFRPRPRPRPAPKRPIIRPPTRPSPRPSARPSQGIPTRPGGRFTPSPTPWSGIITRPRPLLRTPSRGIRQPRTRSTRRYQSEIRRLIPNSPDTALSELAGYRGQHLKQSARVQLGQQAIDQLGVQASKSPWNGLVRIRRVQREAGRIDPALKQGVDALARIAQRQVVQTSVQEVADLTARSGWSEAGQRADTWLGRLDTVQGQAEVKQALGAVRKVGQRVTHLDRVEQALNAVQGKGPRQPFRTLEPAHLPSSVKAPIEGLRALEQVQVLARGRWRRPPHVASLRQNVSGFEQALARIPGADSTLGKRILQDLAVKALLEGHFAEFKSLLPRDGPPEHAARLLRDIKALATGEGKVHTWAGQEMVPDKPGGGIQGPRGPPPGLKPLIPEGKRAGWRPLPKEKASEGLPSLAQAEKVGQQLQTQARKGVESERKVVVKQQTQIARQLRVVQSQLHRAQTTQAHRFREVERSLDRRLSATERMRVQLLIAQQQRTALIVAALQKQNEEDEEEKFLQEVAFRLSRPLSTSEQQQALRLRKQGRRATEVADILANSRQAKTSTVPGAPMIR